jgi:hypothetical protein
MFQPQGKNELAKTCLKKYQLFRLFTVKRWLSPWTSKTFTFVIRCRNAWVVSSIC